MYRFIVKNAVIYISIAINIIKSGYVATFNNDVNRFLRNDVCRNGIGEQIFCNNIVFACFLFKQIYLFRCELVYVLHNIALLQNRDKNVYHWVKIISGI